jgi:hypothetical protein
VTVGPATAGAAINPTKILIKINFFITSKLLSNYVSSKSCQGAGVKTFLLKLSKGRAFALPLVGCIYYSYSTKSFFF